LKQLYAKLLELRKVQDSIPIVKIFEVSLNSHGLLVAMEEVRVLQNLIDQGDAEQFAVSVLRTFARDGSTGKKWLHLDICPKNIGVRDDGTLAFLDLDSVYLESSTGYLVTVPAWKPFRAPDAIFRRVQDGLVQGTLDGPTAAQKVRFEVLLAATECVFGALPVDAGGFLDEARLDRWLATAEKDDPVAVVVRKEFKSAVSGGPIRELPEIAADIEKGLATRSTATVRKVVVPNRDAQESTLPAAVPGAGERASAFDVQWVALKPSAHALRAGKLNRQMVVEYKRALEACLRADPKHPELWEELLLVLISYEKDARAAWDAVTEAVKHLPEHAGLLRTLDVVRPWFREVKS
jgi:hypothetical protein